MIETYEELEEARVQVGRLSRFLAEAPAPTDPWEALCLDATRAQLQRLEQEIAAYEESQHESIAVSDAPQRA